MIVSVLLKLQVRSLICLTGANGHGKSTLANHLRDSYTVVNIGSLISQSRRDPRYQETLTKTYDKGVLPGKLVFTILKHHLETLTKCKNDTLLLEGVPRSYDQLRYFREIIREPLLNFRVVVHKLLPFAEVLERSKLRYLCSLCLAAVIQGKCVACNHLGPHTPRFQEVGSDFVRSTFLRFRDEGAFILDYAYPMVSLTKGLFLLQYSSLEEWRAQILR